MSSLQLFLKTTLQLGVAVQDVHDTKTIVSYCMCYYVNTVNDESLV